MCVVSNVGDFYGRQWQPYIQQPQQEPLQGGTGLGSLDTFTFVAPVSREEFEKLRAEVLEMKQLLIKAKEIDEKTGQPDCEMEDKVKVLKTVAKAFGVSLDEVFKAEK